MHIRWHEIDHRLRGVDGLDDVLSIDLNFLIRQMQPPLEQQYRHGPLQPAAPSTAVRKRLWLQFANNPSSQSVLGCCRLWTAADGSFGVDKVALPRVYHVTLVLQLTGTDVEANDRATVLHKWVLTLMPGYTLSLAAPCRRWAHSQSAQHGHLTLAVLCAVQGPNSFVCRRHQTIRAGRPRGPAQGGSAAPPAGDSSAPEPHQRAGPEDSPCERAHRCQ